MPRNCVVMKICIECASTRKVAVPLSKNGRRASRDAFTTVRDSLFKSQKVNTSHPGVN